MKMRKDSMATATATKKYDESSIGMLEGLEAVRHRPSIVYDEVMGKRANS
jgi:DNA gyrase/topoisomerase IV subunit B